MSFDSAFLSSDRRFFGLARGGALEIWEPEVDPLDAGGGEFSCGSDERRAELARRSSTGDSDASVSAEMEVRWESVRISAGYVGRIK